MFKPPLCVCVCVFPFLLFQIEAVALVAPEKWRKEYRKEFVLRFTSDWFKRSSAMSSGKRKKKNPARLTSGDLADFKNKRKVKGGAVYTVCFPCSSLAAEFP